MHAVLPQYRASTHLQPPPKAKLKAPTPTAAAFCAKMASFGAAHVHDLSLSYSSKAHLPPSPEIARGKSFRMRDTCPASLA